MKRFIAMLVSLLWFSTSSFGGGDTLPVITVTGVIPPTNSSSSSVAISAVTGSRNCLTHFSFSSSAISSFTVIDGTLASGTTIWAAQSGANQPVGSDRNADNAICGNQGTAMTLNATGDGPLINYQGYTRNNR